MEVNSCKVLIFKWCKITEDKFRWGKDVCSINPRATTSKIKHGCKILVGKIKWSTARIWLIQKRAGSVEKKRSPEENIKSNSKIVDLHLIISAVILDVNGLNTSIKRQVVRVNRQARSNYMLFADEALQI